MRSNVGSHKPRSDLQLRSGAAPVLTPSLHLSPQSNPASGSNFSPLEIWHTVLALDGKRKSLGSQWKYWQGEII